MDNASPWQAMARATQAEARDIVAELNIEGPGAGQAPWSMPWARSGRACWSGTGT